MKKYFFQKHNLAAATATVFFVCLILIPQLAHAGLWETINCVSTSGAVDCALRNLVLFITNAVLQLLSLLTSLGAMVLNGVVYYTVVDMAGSLNRMGAINTAWGVIRDIANMSFIFILLYAAIKTILGVGGDTKKIIVNVIIVALLINFSLFFTKLVIDVANVLAIFFYDAVAPGATAGGTVTELLTRPGLSNAFMNKLNLQTIYKTTGAEILTPTLIVIIGVMGSIMLLIAAFIFFAVSLMFITRYAILILVLILSPLAFMAFVLPALKPYANQWRQALVGQAFFAPIYFLLTWVTLQILGGVMGAFQLTTALQDPAAALSNLALGGIDVPVNPGAFAMLLNFVVIIVFLIASLVISKQFAGRTPDAISTVTTWAKGAAVGSGAWVGRNTLGRASQAASDSRWLKERAPDSRMARLALTAAKKTGSASFDVRNTKAASAVGLDAGKGGGQGGYRQKREDTVKRRMDFLGELSDSVTGRQVENEMSNRRWTGARDEAILRGAGLSGYQIAAINATGASKRQMETLGINARQAEIMRRQVQKDLLAGADVETANRKDRYLHNLSQTHWYTPNQYSGVTEDAEAARRMRGRKKQKGRKNRDEDYWDDEDKDKGTSTNNTTTGTGPATGTPPTTTPTGGPGPGTPPPPGGPGPSTPPTGGRGGPRRPGGGRPPRPGGGSPVPPPPPPSPATPPVTSPTSTPPPAQSTQTPTSTTSNSGSGNQNQPLTPPAPLIPPQPDQFAQSVNQSSANSLRDRIGSEEVELSRAMADKNIPRSKIDEMIRHINFLTLQLNDIASDENKKAA